VAASSKDADGQYRRVPVALELDPAAAYVHLTSNNTVEGTQFHAFPDTGAVLQVADMSSDLLSRPLDARRFGFIYAGAQKNLGPSGIVVALAHREFLARARKDIPRIFRYQTQAEADSLYNTPNTWGVYLIHKVLRWIEAQGGLPGMEARNRQKAQALYGALEGLSGFYALPVEPASRSLMNVVFRCPDEAQDKRFVADSEAAGLVGLKGHRTVGGLRASLYNAVSQSDVEALVSFARDFARRRG
jgi:phosphoserine aminotransferase